MSEGNGLFGRDDYITPAPRRFKEFEATLNGQTKTVRIQSLTALERAHYELGNLGTDGRWSPHNTERMNALLVAMTVVDRDGNRILKESDVEAMMEQDGDFIGDIYDEAMDHTGIRSKSLRRLEKNLNSGEDMETPSD